MTEELAVVAALALVLLPPAAALTANRVRPVLAGLLALTLHLVLVRQVIWPVSVSIAVAVAILVSTALAQALAARLQQADQGRQVDRDTMRRQSALLQQAAQLAPQLADLEPERAVAAIVEAVGLLGFDGGCIARYDSESSTWAIRYPWQLPESFTQRSSWHLGGVAGVLRQRTAQVVTGYAASGVADDDLAADGVTALVAVPAYEDPPYEAALLAVRRGGPDPDEETISALAVLAGQTAAIISNARGFAQARRAAEQLQQVDRMKTDFLATISHELRTPLAILQAASKTLAVRWADVPEATRTMLLQQVQENSVRLSDVVVSMLDFSAVADAGSTEASPVRLSRLLEEVAAGLGELFKAGQLTVQVPPDVVALGHATLLAKAVEQLLTNAAQHTPPGTPVLLRVDLADDLVTVVVADRGPGLPEGATHGLGERFFRLSDPEHRGTSGLGLGLALVREIMRLHDTTLRSTSGPTGTTFAFDLPAAHATDDIPATIRTAGLPGRSRQPDEGAASGGGAPPRAEPEPTTAAPAAAPPPATAPLPTAPPTAPPPATAPPAAAPPPPPGVPPPPPPSPTTR